MKHSDWEELPKDGAEASIEPQAERLSTSARRVVVCVNPKAGPRGSGARGGQLVAALEARGLDAELLSDLEDACRTARRYHGQASLRALVAVGGDGTAAAVANRTPEGLPIALMPGGNENLLARYLDLDLSPEALAEVIAEGITVRLDAGRAGDRLFLIMFSAGFDAEVVQRVHCERRGHISQLGYLKPIAETIRSYEYPPIRIACPAAHPAATSRLGEGEAAPGSGGAGVPRETCRRPGPTGDEEGGPMGAETTVEARWLFSFNLPCYGGGFRLMPTARGADGWLDVCVFQGAGWWNALRLLASVLAGVHTSLSDCVTFRAERLRVESPARVPYQLDGDPGGYLPVEIEVVPRRLRLVVPRGRLHRPL